MIKTLRITGFISLLLSAAFFVFFAVNVARGADAIDSLLKSPTIIEKFKKAGVGKKSSKDKKSPLVKEAEGFARYLNPPAPKAPKRSAKPRKRSTPKPKPKAPSVKFKLIGTSFYASNPSLSLALIDVPGKGLRWVRQSGKVGRMVIEEVKDGAILVNNGSKIVELKAKRSHKKSLLRGKSSNKKDDSGDMLFAMLMADKSEELEEPAPPKKARKPMSDKDMKLFKQLMDMEGDGKGGARDEQSAKVKSLFSEFKADRVSEAEANDLDELGKKLKDSSSALDEARKRKKELSKRARTPRKRRSSTRSNKKR